MEGSDRMGAKCSVPTPAIEKPDRERASSAESWRHERRCRLAQGDRFNEDKPIVFLYISF
jgi:hypothetical protein